MKRVGAAARVRLAEANLACAERALIESARPWRLRLSEHRNALLVGGGFASGWALTFFPSRWWARIGAFAGATAAAVARSAFTPTMVGAVMAQFRRGSGASSTSSQASSGD